MGKLNGCFTEKSGWDEKTTGITTVDADELAEFIEESLKNQKIHTPNKRVIIGTVSDEAQKRIEEKCGSRVKNINIDNHSIVHAITQLHHNLEPEDILFAVEVINTATDIELSDEKHQDCEVLIFQKDIDGDITFLTEVHAKNRYLLVCDAWRQKKARSRRSSDAAKKPPRTYAHNDSPHNELLTVSHKLDE